MEQSARPNLAHAGATLLQDHPFAIDLNLTTPNTMELKPEVPFVTPRQAATVVMLRDGSTGLEVFLVKRHGLSDVLGGAYVFPGGKLDESDTQVDAATHLDQDATHLHAALGEPDIAPSHATGLYVAALREAFEESGVLFTANAAAAHAAQAQAPSLPFNQLLAQLGLRLQTSAVLPWARWITPQVPPHTAKRFDTRFFVAAAPSDQEARHDNHEATESVWLAPRAALDQYWSREIELAPPQILSLAQLSRHASVASVLQSARNQPPPVILPQALIEDGALTLCFPGDPKHPVATRALPGPTRLVQRNNRFEPPEGFASLFD